MRARVFTGTEGLPPHCSKLFSNPEADLFQSRDWVVTLRQHAVTPGDLLRLYATEGDDGMPIGVLPAIYSRLNPIHPRAKVLHFAGSEGLVYAPVLAEGLDSEKSLIAPVFELLGADRHGIDVLRFSPLDPRAPFFDELIRALHRFRWRFDVYHVLGDRYEQTNGLPYRDYLANRPLALRQRLDAGARPRTDRPPVAFRLLTEPEDVLAGCREYDRILLAAKSWHAEPAAYLPQAMRVAAAAGALRLGFADVGGVPVATQFWIVTAGAAHCQRMVCAHGDGTLPIGDMLTGYLVEHMLDVDLVGMLNMGYFPQALAEDWAPRNRQRVGVIACNPRTWRGFKAMLRHIDGKKLVSIPRRIRRRLARLVS